MPGKNRNIVYSTHGAPQESAVVRQGKKPPASTAGPIKIQREKKGRGGKTVTVIYGMGGDLKAMQREIQKYCGTGGSSKNGTIEIQGDHGQKIKTYLEQKGFKPKLSGGY